MPDMLHAAFVKGIGAPEVGSLHQRQGPPLLSHLLCSRALPKNLAAFATLPLCKRGNEKNMRTTGALYASVPS